MLIEASTPLTIRRRSGDVRLVPGQPLDFPEDEALKLLAKAPGRVREATGSLHHTEVTDERKLTQESGSVEALPVAPGDRITWQIGAGGKVKEGVVDFVHTYLSEMWAFCTLPDGGWTAVNVKYIRKQ